MEQAYTQTQLDNLVRLVHVLKNALPTLCRVSGHEMLDREQLPASDNPEVVVRRKVDPGPKFPWIKFIAATGLEFLEAPGLQLRSVSAPPPR
jgi:N-acetylmuramoyl-L-alanine amidase